MKKCSKCGELKPLESFSKDAYKKDGLRSHCRSCGINYSANYYALNKKSIREKMAIYQDSNKIILQKNQRNWQIANKEKIKIYSSNRRAKKQSNGVYFINKNFFEKLYGSPCVFCSSKINIQADHIIPIALGGTHSEGNLQPLCKSCNSSKKDKLFSVWRYSELALQLKERNKNAD